jgi:hypothetical protein
MLDWRIGWNVHATNPLSLWLGDCVTRSCACFDATRLKIRSVIIGKARGLAGRLCAGLRDWRSRFGVRVVGVLRL